MCEPISAFATQEFRKANFLPEILYPKNPQLLPITNIHKVFKHL